MITTLKLRDPKVHKVQKAQQVVRNFSFNTRCIGLHGYWNQYMPTCQLV